MQKPVYEDAGAFIIKKKDSQTKLLQIRLKTNYQTEEFQSNS